MDELLKRNLLDQIVISILSHLLGGGIRLFEESNLEQLLQLKRSVAYPSALVQLWYDIRVIPPVNKT